MLKRASCTFSFKILLINFNELELIMDSTNHPQNHLQQNLGSPTLVTKSKPGLTIQSSGSTFRSEGPKNVSPNKLLSGNRKDGISGSVSQNELLHGDGRHIDPKAIAHNKLLYGIKITKGEPLYEKNEDEKIEVTSPIEPTPVSNENEELEPEPENELIHEDERIEDHKAVIKNDLVFGNRRNESPESPSHSSFVDQK